MDVWTVDTWKVREGREKHFLENCRGLGQDSLTLYRDLEEPGLFWSPAKWESLQALNEWRGGGDYGSALQAVREDVLDHVTHVMEAVAGFPSAAESD